jgi:2-keto-3-deoxy-L-rhamnonate aldolase RhmA
MWRRHIKKSVKALMKEGKLAICAHASLADPQVVEIIGLTGFDAAYIDIEHTAFDLRMIGEMIRAAELVNITPFVRVPDYDPKLILRILDMGAQGIVIPHVNSLDGAKKKYTTFSN